MACAAAGARGGDARLPACLERDAARSRAPTVRRVHAVRAAGAGSERRDTPLRALLFVVLALAPAIEANPPAATGPNPGCVRSCRASNSTGCALATCCPSVKPYAYGCWEFATWPRSYGCKRALPWGREYTPGKTVYESLYTAPGKNRWYGVHLPPAYTLNETKLPPLVISMHGWGGRVSSHEALTGLSALADEENFIVVYPQGEGDANASMGNWFSWNGVGSNGTSTSKGPTCNKNHTKVACYQSCERALGSCDTTNVNGPCDWSTCADDVKFLELLLDTLGKSLCFDRSRVYMTGFSNGAMWNFEMARSRLAGRIAAFAPVSGSPHYGYNDKPNLDQAAGDSPMPLMVVHGTKDGVIPANTSDELPYSTSTQSYVGWRYTLTDDVLKNWGDSQNCTDPWKPYAAPDVSAAQVLETGLWCVARCQLVSCAWTGSHQWPGVNATFPRPGSPGMPTGARLVWGFLKQHSLK